MMEFSSIGQALCLGSCVIFGMVALSGMTGGRGIERNSRRIESRGLVWLSMAVAFVIQTLGLILLYTGMERLPDTALDFLVLSGLAMGGIALWLGRLNAHPVVRSPLAGGAFVTSTLVFALEPAGIGQAPLPTLLFGILSIAVAAILFAVGVLCFRRYLRRGEGGRGASVVALLLTLLALFAPWGGFQEQGRPFAGVHAESGELAEGTIVLRELETGQTFVRTLPLRVSHEGLQEGRNICLALVFLALLFSVLEAAAPSVFYRMALVFTLSGAVVGNLILLGCVGWVFFSGVEISLETLSGFEDWMNSLAEKRNALPGVAVVTLRWGASEGLEFSLRSNPALWFLLLTSAPILAIAGGYRARALTSPVRNQKAADESEALVRAELGLITAGICGTIALVATGTFWSIWKWGRVEAGDPRFILSLALLGLSWLYIMEHRRGKEGEKRTILLGIVLGVLSVVYLIGPEFGWTVASAFPPFP